MVKQRRSQEYGAKLKKVFIEKIFNFRGRFEVRKFEVVDSYRFDIAIAWPRFSRYDTACRRNKVKALKLYRANITLSQKMYALIGVFEIVLRNSIDRHFMGLKGNRWLEDAVQPGGYLDVSEGCEDSFHVVQEVLQKLGIEYTHDGLIAKLTFGFWTYQFAKKHMLLPGIHCWKYFPIGPSAQDKRIFSKN